ncbi:16S rRNA (guanine(966)-N(2))-methyltransferase RsmD [Pelagovum pacificum]|uniref:16S rRNA (Guanine(966)-N(2))-methyltransferase RsmD n=1 Tax=Pelagovum pacificum TaxID=2588711 RepID=A0A5C5GHQ7_9RHOB|nr:16S rRNA (guanine(966)-N(2))-methyltransferase RsmD [Pelagovum pacificum]QQA42616.1 16S rRNA (guanine(966)-N(2))-methyltransferase RsmD [Pelagovum pacificum]TNY34233.1 16S rRNA (guanine(966)-N(2))-methyltransferase RsmD [Pelagovum pacificum]
MRIIGGQHRGLRLAEVGKGDAGAHLRPTPDRVRESLFNILASHGLPDGVRVLDLFAGTGALGLEALSRGAVHCTFVDSGRVAQRLLRENLGKARREGDATLLTCDVTRLPAGEGCGLVFLDPPYGKGLAPKALARAVDGGWLAPDAVVVCEDSTPIDPPEGFDLLDRRKYGDTHLTLICFARET